jgi:hypothetical protein
MWTPCSYPLFDELLWMRTPLLGTLRLSVMNIIQRIMNKCVVLLAGLLFLAAGCKGTDPDPIVTPIGGKGGNATLHITPRHHGRQIDSCTVYIKYNATDKPSDDHYDDSAQCVQVSGLPVATFSGLKKGNYYLYGYGWDPTLSPPQHVKGGYAYPVTSETDQTTDLAVSEN